MKTVLQLIVVMVLMVASVQGARAAYKHYAFVDAIEESMLFVGRSTEEDLANRVLRLAGDHQVPLDPDQLTVTREPYMVNVEAPYTDVVHVLPGVYKRQWDFEVSVHVRQLEDTRPRRGPPPPRRQYQPKRAK